MSTGQEALFQKATQFITQYYKENNLQGLAERLEQVGSQIALRATYDLTEEELSFGAKLAWRNSNHCIGRLFWKSLKVRDRRTLHSAKDIFEDLLEHLEFGFNQGKIKSVISIYSSEGPSRFRIWNKQLIRYAGYLQEDDSIVGDPDSVEFTQICQNLGWSSKGTAFDVLPIVIQKNEETPEWFELPESLKFQIPLRHPDYPQLDELGLQWYALPVISDMRLEIGGQDFRCAPFHGWYMLTEIAVRNLGDEHRYNLIPKIAQKLGWDTSQNRKLWKDKGLLVLMEMVLSSFQSAGVTLGDHHTASQQFLEFCQIESQKGREVQADWSWIVPPTAGSTTGVFHREWPNEVHSPNFFYQKPKWIKTRSAENRASACPYSSLS